MYKDENVGATGISVVSICAVSIAIIKVYISMRNFKWNFTICKLLSNA